MKKLLFMLSITSLLLISCKSGYPNLKDGLYADIQTNKGNMVVELFYQQTPVTVANFVSLAEGTNTYVVDSLKKKKYYDGVIFHRVIPNFMIQGGDPTGTGMGSPGYQFGDEIVDTLQFTKKGQLAMANAGPSTNGSQFFITQVPTQWLTGKHTIFGQVVQGELIIDTIANVPTAGADKPQQDVVINKVVIIRKGKDAKSFDAPKVFERYMKEQTQIAHQKEAQRAEFLQKVKQQMQEATELPTGVKVFFLNKNPQGAKPNFKQNVAVNYAGYFASDMMLFDSNVKEVASQYDKYDSRRDMMGGYAPMPVEYSQQAPLIAGFKDALLSLKVGEKVRAFIPSHLGYGEAGTRGIPPNSDLIFDIEIVEILK